MFYTVKTLKSKERGAALVEFALVIPLLLLVIFGIIEFSILFYDKAVITNASREAAREWVIYRDVKLTKAEITTVVDNYTLNRLISLKSGSSPVTTMVPDPPNVFTTGQSLRLTVSYAYDFVFLPAFMNGLIPTVNLNATTVMRAE